MSGGAARGMSAACVSDTGLLARAAEMLQVGTIRLDAAMLAFAYQSGHTVALHVKVAFDASAGYAAGAGGLAAVLAWLATLVPRRITYRVLFQTPVVDAQIDDLQVSYRGSDLSDPHVLGIELRYRGSRDLRASSFENRPFCIDVGAPVVGVIHSRARRDGELSVEHVGRELRLGPCLVQRDERVRLVVLLDGATGRLSHRRRPADVRVRQRRAADRAREFGLLPKVVTWAVVLFIVYYLVSNPHGAAGAVSDALSGLRSAGNSLASFVSNV